MTTPIDKTPTPAGPEGEAFPGHDPETKARTRRELLAQRHDLEIEVVPDFALKQGETPKTKKEDSTDVRQ